MDWKPYKPQWLIAVVQKHGADDQQWLVEALLLCTTAARTSDSEARAEYHYFVDPAHANQPGADWQIADIVCFETAEADVNVDVLIGNRVGGVEILPYRRPVGMNEEL